MSRILPTDFARRPVGEKVFRQISDALNTLNQEPPPGDDSEPHTERAVSLLRKSGAFSIGYSSQLGGPGFTAVEQTEIISLIARYDASVAWRVMVGMDGGLFSNYLDPEVVHGIIPDQKAIFAGVLAPNGTSKELPGGYEISGRWSMASGITSAEMVFAGFKTPDGQSRVAILPSDGISIVNDWDSTGLRSSDSSTFIIDRFNVSREATFSWKDSADLPGPLSSPDLQMRKFPGVAIGMTRAALDYARSVANEKESTKNGPWRDSYRVQYTIGECEMLYIAMRESVYGTLDKRWSLLSRGKPYSDFSPDEKIDTVAARVFAIRQAREIVRKLYDLFGASSVYRDNPLDRWLRDIETMNQHFLGSSVAIQSAGAFILGGSPESDLIVGEV